MDDIWKPWDEKVGLLFTQIPNCVIQDIIKGKLTQNQIRVFLYICRMDFGFKSNKGQTKSLDNKEISKETGMKIPHVTKALKVLINKQFILRGDKSGAAFRYSVNLLRYDLKMNRYKITDDIMNLSKGEKYYDQLLYLYRSGKEIKEMLGIIYKSKGYNNTKKGYKEEDINTNIKQEIPPKVAITNLSSVLSEFRKEIKINNSLKTVLKYMNATLKTEIPDPSQILTEYMENVVKTKDEQGKVTEQPEYLKIYNKALKGFEDWLIKVSESK